MPNKQEKAATAARTLLSVEWLDAELVIWEMLGFALQGVNGWDILWLFFIFLHAIGGLCSLTIS